MKKKEKFKLPEIKPQTPEERRAGVFTRLEQLQREVEKWKAAKKYFPNVKYELAVSQVETLAGDMVDALHLLWHGSSQSIPSVLSFAVDVAVANVNGHYEVIKHRYDKPGARVAL